MRLWRRRRFRLDGVMTLTIRDADGSVADERVFHNTITVNGLTLLAQAINWSGVSPVNDVLGDPFTSTLAGPVYGALGTDSTAPAQGDAKLTTEVARAAISGAATSPASVGVGASWTWQFFFGLPSTSYTIAECGVFL